MMAAAAPESPSPHSARPPPLTAAGSPMCDYEEEESLPGVGEKSFRMENLSISKDFSSQKLLQMHHKSQKLAQVERTTTQSTKKVFKSRKRKMAVATIEDEAISPASNRRLQSLSRKMAIPNVEDEANSPPSNRRVQSLSRKMAVTSMSRRVISKKVIDRAVCVSREVARKRNEQTINSQSF
ncbi:unnamed protein product [Urochloa humidicola]